MERKTITTAKSSRDINSDWVLRDVAKGLNNEKENKSSIKLGSLVSKYGWRVAFATSLLFTYSCGKADTKVSPEDAFATPLPHEIFTPETPLFTHTPVFTSTPTSEIIAEPIPQVVEETPVISDLQSPFPKGVSTMNKSKDLVCNQLENHQIESLAKVIKEVGATHMGIEVPWGTPQNCDADTLDYMRRFIEGARKEDLNVWLRPTIIGFEDIYEADRDTSHDHLEDVKRYLLQTLPLLSEGDIITPLPEPQNTGIAGLNCGDNCMFSGVEEFNAWVRDLARVTREALVETGQEENVDFLCCGFDGFVTIGIHNPDHEGRTFLEDDTLRALNDIVVVDHYPPEPKLMESDLRFMAEGLSSIFGRHIDIVVGEWGTIPREGFTGAEPSEEEPGKYQTETDMRYLGEGIITGAREGYVIGSMYWQVGPAGRETLVYVLDGDLATTPHYETLREIYESLP
jgi:hypothetical protein